MPNDKVRDVAKAMLVVHEDAATPQPVKDWLAELMARLMDADVPDARFIKGSAIPSGLGNQADEYAAVREERLRVEKEAKAIKDRETEIYNCIMSTLDESTDTGAMGHFYGVQRVEKDQVQVKDWDAVWAHIQKTGDFNLLQKRVNDKAVREMAEEGDAVPGAEIVKVPTLSFTKVKS